MTAMREWYRRANAQWPEGELPVPTAEEAVRGARKLWRFVRGEKCPIPVVVTSGNRRTWVYRGELRVNPDCRDGHGGGWRSLVHDLGHYLGGGHSKPHARLEARLIREVVRRGWLAPTPATAATPAPRVDAKRELQAVRHERIKRRIVAWERREARAKRALAKLVRQSRYYERALAA